MTRARARSLWLAGPALLAACSSSPSTQAPTTTPIVDTTASPTPVATTSISVPPSTTLPPPTTLVPVDPSVLIPVAVGNKPFPADADDLATEHHGYTGDPNATLQTWLITPMAVPSGPDVRLLGFERTVGISSTTAVFLTGTIDPETTLTSIEAALAPSPTYIVTPTTRTDGTVTIHGFDAQPTTVQGDPPGWSVEASAVAQLGIVRIKRSDYAFDKVVPTFSDLPATLQPSVLNQDAIAVTVGGVLTSIAYEYGTRSLGDSPAHRTRLSYDIANDFATATAGLAALLTTGWDRSEQADALFFTSTTTSEVWTVDEFGGTTHLTYDTGS
ncbi:MAG: hypothetical protein M3P52_02325 [Actinomycetota bacterium]|nr:hypothetical protein [Actinomycetota bacterium]